MPPSRGSFVHLFCSRIRHCSTLHPAPRRCRHSRHLTRQRARGLCQPRRRRDPRHRRRALHFRNRRRRCRSSSTPGRRTRPRRRPQRYPWTCCCCSCGRRWSRRRCRGRRCPRRRYPRPCRRCRCRRRRLCHHVRVRGKHRTTRQSSSVQFSALLRRCRPARSHKWRGHVIWYGWCHVGLRNWSIHSIAYTFCPPPTSSTCSTCIRYIQRRLAARCTGCQDEAAIAGAGWPCYLMPLDCLAGRLNNIPIRHPVVRPDKRAISTSIYMQMLGHSSFPACLHLNYIHHGRH